MNAQMKKIKNSGIRIAKENSAFVIGRTIVNNYFPLIHCMNLRFYFDPKKIFNTFFPDSGIAPEQREEAYRDMTRAMWKEGFQYDEYFYYDIFHKSKEERATFLNEVNRYAYYRKLNTIGATVMFLNKWATYQKYQPFYKRDIVFLKKPEDFEVFREFAAKNPKFIVKPYNGTLGRNVAVYEPQSQEELREIFDTSIRKHGKLFCEAYVKQVKELAAFNESSLNTLRVPTVLTGDSPETYQVHLFYPSIRFGRAGSLVDNAGAGGITVQINGETGALSAIGRDEQSRTYTEHPDSHQKFEGFVVPHWEEAVAFVRELALVNPKNRLIGWDLALTDDGWLMIEGNDRSQFVGRQIIDRIGKKPELDALIAKK